MAYYKSVALLLKNSLIIVPIAIKSTELQHTVGFVAQSLRPIT